MNKEQQIKQWFEINFDKNIENINITKELYDFGSKEKRLKFDYYALLKAIEHVENNRDIDIVLFNVMIRIGCNLEIHFNETNFFYILENTLIRKNRDYGNSFDKSINKFGYVYVAIELDKKKNRLHNLLKTKEKPNYESLKDTLIDIADYCILSLIYIENKNKDNE